MRSLITAACLLSFIPAPAMAAELTPKVAILRGEAKSKAPKVPLLEKLACRSGPNDEQVRLIVEAVKGRAMEFAFYTRLGTRVCSIHGRRGDAHTKWEDSDAETGTAHIKLFTGSALLEYAPGRVKVTFSDVDRMHYCGMYGELNGLVEAVLKKADCSMHGVFEGANETEKKEKAVAAPAHAPAPAE
jgi:hypothetical protein